MSEPVSASSWDDLFFENQIRPVLVEKCLPCHSQKHAESGLRVDSLTSLLEGGDSGPAINITHPDQSLLLRAIAGDSDVSAMPPQEENRLRPDQIQDFKKWVADGAKWPRELSTLINTKLWSLDPIRKVPSSIHTESTGAQHPIDRLIGARTDSPHAHPHSRADKRSLLRRATYDLTGLPPSYEEVSAFEEDHTEDAFEKCIERLLASPAYGERWGRHWLDVVRYADTAGETADYPVPTAWRYRDYVIQAFQTDKPYDKFLKEQIAGDILANEAPSAEQFAEQTIATGFLAISRRFGFDSENYHHLTIQDTIDTLGQSMLGLSLGCARCHDHKFDPIPMRDYYALYGIFESSRYPFPGSEQKQKVRCLAPLMPPSKSRPIFRDFESRVADSAKKLNAFKLPVPQAFLRSLHDADGDFELQAPAAGGSNGVLVPPWLYQGRIEVTNAAQSPFLHLFSRGRVGVHIPTQSQPYHIEQRMLNQLPNDTNHLLYFNIDWKLDAAEGAAGVHRLWLGTADETMVELLIDSRSLKSEGDSDRASSSPVSIPVEPGQWYNLQLKCDMVQRTIYGTLSNGRTEQTWELPIPGAFSGFPERFVLESMRLENRSGAMPSDGTIHSLDDIVVPGLELDHVSLQFEPIAPASLESPDRSEDVATQQVAILQEELKRIVDSDASFEFQQADVAPIEPWGPGPNSVVRILRDAQSPFVNLFPKGELGLQMPNRAEYDGFGRTFATPLEAGTTREAFVAFDFRCGSQTLGGQGTWRFYVGHNPGPSPAVELYFNAEQLFRRSGSHIESVAKLQDGVWYQVRITIDLQSKTYQGTIGTQEPLETFTGSLADTWDGVLDYTFIDSYGNIPGVRPELNVDNYAIRSVPLEALPSDRSQEEFSVLAGNRARAKELRRLISTERDQAMKHQATLEQWLTDGPIPMAYAMAEGTPHSARIQLRGEPDQLGEEVPRGFIQALGDNRQVDHFQGSGRLELANWIANRDNPLTARVMVNRVWQYHFGEGIVKTPNDFGMRGTPPTHPELLDFLALYFMEHGWSVKQLHRFIMSSEAYQNATRAIDPQVDLNQSKLEANMAFSRRRLSAEEIRDSILAASEGLDLSPAQGHPFPSPTSWGFSQHAPFLATYEHQHRSVYLMTQRIRRHPFLALFDGADPNASTAKRNTTTVPTQALYFLNDPMVHSASERIAKSICQRSPSFETRTSLLYRRLFARSPDDAERNDTLRFLEEYQQALREEPSIVAEFGSDAKAQIELMSWSACVRTLLGSNEFLFVE